MESQNFRSKKYSTTKVFPPQFPSDTKSDANDQKRILLREDRIKFARLVTTGVIVVLGGSFHFGYQISIINPLADVLQEFLVKNLESNIKLEPWMLTILWPFFAGLVFIGALIGAMIAPAILDKMGAKNAFLIASFTLSFSFILAALSKWLTSALVFIIARFLSGVGIGMNSTTQTVYLTEISPVKYRGFMGSMTGLANSIGFVIASALGLPTVLGTSLLWHWAYLLETIPSFLLIVSMLFVLPDSPLFSLKKELHEAAVNCLECYQTKDQAEQRFRELRAEIRTSKLLPDNQPFHHKLRELFRDKASQNALLICLILNATVSFSGILAVSFFGTFLLTKIGFTDYEASLANCLASIFGVLGDVTGSLTIEKIGRRRLVIGGLTMLALLNLFLMVLMFSFNSYRDVRFGWVFLGVFVIFLFIFSFGVGPTSWFLATELTNSTNRSLVQSLSISCQFLTCFISPLIFFPLYQLISAFSFLLFIAPLIFTSIYLYMVLPETKNEPTEKVIQKLRQCPSIFSASIRDGSTETEMEKGKAESTKS